MLVTSVEWCDLCMQLLLYSGWGQLAQGYLLLQVCAWGLDFCPLYGIVGCPLF